MSIWQATLHGNITNDGGETILERGFVFGTVSRGDPGDTAPADSDYASYVYEDGEFTTGEFDAVASNLDADTYYYFRAYAYNVDGYAYSGELSLTTWSGIKPVLISPADEAIDQLMVGLYLEWEAVDEADVYHVQVSENADMTLAFIDDNTIPASEYPEYEIMDTLDADTTYYWRVRAGREEST